jgi:hypothetical protein
MRHSPLEGQGECFPGLEAIVPRISEMFAIFVSAKSPVHAWDLP